MIASHRDTFEKTFVNTKSDPMSIVDNATVSFQVPSSILQGTASETIESFSVWFMKGTQGPYEFEPPADDPIILDMVYTLSTIEVPDFLLTTDDLKVFSMLRTNERTYRLVNDVTFV